MSQYDFNLNDSSTWRNYPPPLVDSSFQDELVKIAGLNPHGKPILRLIWGGSEQQYRGHDREGRDQYFPKYMLGFSERVVGYVYTNDKAQRCSVARIDQVPFGAFAQAVVVREYIGRQRFIVEKWASPEDLIRGKRFQQRHDPETGALLIRSFPREGEYEWYFEIENADQTFKMPDGHDLEIIRDSWHYTQTHTQAEILRDIEKADELKAAQDRKLMEETWSLDSIMGERNEHSIRG
jgi:hypothetical protein